MSVPRPDTSSIPDAPGAYLFRDGDGRVVYVGKARSLRKRLASYWGKPLHARTQAMTEAAQSVEWVLASGEVDALMLEYNLIQRYLPRFNIRYRDDKSYPYLALTVGETWPRAQVMRGAKRKNVRYFGPFGHAWAIRDTLDALTRVFPVRTCTNSFFDSRARAQRPCLYYDIGRCSGPCVPSVTGVTEESYRADVDALGDFLSGNTKPVVARLDAEMREAAERQEYEQAAKLRDQLAAARRAMETQEMVLTQPEDLDVIGLAEDDLEAAFQVFFVRGGRVLGRRGWVVDRVEDLNRAELVASFVRQLYMERTEVPPRVLVPALPADREVLEAWLSTRRSSKVTIGVPERGAKRKLMEVVNQNAAEAFHRHKLRRASDFGARSRALSELAEQLGLPQAPLRIECYDISNLGETDTVGSMVVFEDGLPKRSDYRRFEIKGVPGQDDFASMEEMLRRRFARLIRERDGAGRVHDGGSRTRRRSSWSTAARGSSASAARSSPTSASTSRTSASRSGSRRSTFPGQSGAADDPARVRGAVRPAAHPRRGAPVRHHVPPAEAREAGAGRRRSTTCPASVPRGRRRSSSGSGRSRGCATPRWTRSRPRRGSVRSWRGRSTTGSTTWPARAHRVSA